MTQTRGSPALPSIAAAARDAGSLEPKKRNIRVLHPKYQNLLITELNIAQCAGYHLKTLGPKEGVLYRVGAPGLEQQEKNPSTLNSAPPRSIVPLK